MNKTLNCKTPIMIAFSLSMLMNVKVATSTAISDERNQQSKTCSGSIKLGGREDFTHVSGISVKVNTNSFFDVTEIILKQGKEFTRLNASHVSMAFPERLWALSTTLKKSPQITSIDLRHNQISTEGLEELLKVSSLKEIDLSSNQINFDDFKKIVEFINEQLAINPHFEKKIDLSLNPLRYQTEELRDFLEKGYPSNHIILDVDLRKAKSDSSISLSDIAEAEELFNSSEFLTDEEYNYLNSLLTDSEPAALSNKNDVESMRERLEELGIFPPESSAQESIPKPIAVSSFVTPATVENQPNIYHYCSSQPQASSYPSRPQLSAIAVRSSLEKELSEPPQKKARVSTSGNSIPISFVNTKEPSSSEVLISAYNMKRSKPFTNRRILPGTPDYSKACLDAIIQQVRKGEVSSLDLQLINHSARDVLPEIAQLLSLNNLCFLKLDLSNNFIVDLKEGSLGVEMRWLVQGLETRYHHNPNLEGFIDLRGNNFSKADCSILDKFSTSMFEVRTDYPKEDLRSYWARVPSIEHSQRADQANTTKQASSLILDFSADDASEIVWEGYW